MRYTAEQLKHIWHNAPMGLVLLATELRNAGHDVIICDLERDLVSNQGDITTTTGNLRKLLENTQPGLVGIGMLSVRYLEASRIVRLCDEQRATIGRYFRIVVGNIHATAEPIMTLTDNPGIDVACLGEADKTILDLVNGEPVQHLSGVAFREGNGIVTRPLWYAPNLDELPFPDWHLIDVTFYAGPNYAAHGRMTRPARSLDIALSRGCPYRCSFCAYNKTKCRWNSPEYVVKNIEYMLDSFGIDSIYFVDSSIGNNRRQILRLCEIIVNKNLDKRFYWSANMRSNQVDEELLKLMWRAGCRKLLYGFESGSQCILDAMSKDCTVAQNENVTRLHNKLGFPYHASMIMGFPGETADDLEKTLAWLRRVRPPIVGINTYTPLPGSEDYHRLKATRKINVQDPYIWRKVGEVNSPDAPIFSDLSSPSFWEYFDRMQRLARELWDDAQKSKRWNET